MAIKVQYDITEAVGAPLKAAGVFKLKVASITEHDENDAIMVRWEASNGDGLQDYVGLSGKAAFKFQQYAELLSPRTELKEEGTFDVEKWIGKQADVIVVYDEEYERFTIKDIAKKGSLNAVDYLKALKGSGVVESDEDEEDIDLEDDLDLDDEDEEEEEEPVKKKKSKKKTTVKKTKKTKKPKVVVEEEPEDDEDDFDDLWDDEDED